MEKRDVRIQAWSISQVVGTKTWRVRCRPRPWYWGNKETSFSKCRGRNRNQNTFLRHIVRKVESNNWAAKPPQVWSLRPSPDGIMYTETSANSTGYRMKDTSPMHIVRKVESNNWAAKPPQVWSLRPSPDGIMYTASATDNFISSHRTRYWRNYIEKCRRS